MPQTTQRLIIVGGVAGGASAATRARRLSETAEIVMFERGPDVSFANCGMPYYIGQTIAERSKLLVVTPERLRQRYRLDVRVQTEVTSIDRAAQQVTARNLVTGEETRERYDALILAPGAAPLRPPIPGLDLPAVMTLRNLGDMDRIRAAVTQQARSVVMVGAGFIGLELVENFVRLGLATTLVELQPQILPPLDPEMTTPLLAALSGAGVQVRLGESATRFEQIDGRLVITLSGGDRLHADLAVLGIGVRPENKLAVEAGLEIGPRGGIRVNDRLQTSDPLIYAVGDVAETTDFISGERAQVPLAGPANRQGRIAADNVFGRPARFRGTQGTAIVGLFDQVAALTGKSEKLLRQSGTDYRAIYIHPAHHAGYYPGAEGMTLKLLFEPEQGRILGAQAVGGAGVDKRIDVLATAIQARMTVFDLEELELAYAPQFGSAKDPVNMAGFVAAGWLRGDHPQRHFGDVLSLPIDARPAIIDVRTPEEFSAGSVPGAVNIPVDDLRQRLDEVPADRPVATYCQVGMRGYLATRILRLNGRDAVNLAGGYRTYQLVFPGAMPGVRAARAT